MKPLSTARERITRVLLFTLAAAILGYGALTLETVHSQARVLAPGTAWTAFTVFMLFPVLAGVSTVAGRLGAGLMLLRGFCLSYAVVMIAWIPLMRVEAIPGDRPPWIWDLSMLATVTAGFVWTHRLSWPYIGAVSFGTVVLHGVTSVEEGWFVAVQDGIFLVTLTAILVLPTRAVLRAGSMIDAAYLRLQADAVRDAESAARWSERRRMDALIHDHVLSLLLMAARAEPRARPRLRKGAAEALSALDPERLEETIEAHELAARIRAMVPAGSLWSAEVTTDVQLPGEHASTLVEAAGEAIRNSLQHAGETARSVSLAVDADQVEVRVQDQGRGFVPSQVPSSRLGIRMSIQERMSTIPGGSTRVRSSAGAGTTIDLHWDLRAAPDTVPALPAREPSPVPRPQIASPRISELLRLSGWPGRLMMGLLILCCTINALGNLDQVRSGPIAVAALLLTVLGAAILLREAPDPFPARLTAAVLAISVLLSLASWNLPSTGWPGWASWYWFASTVVLLVLLLRGRVIAVAGYAMHVIVVALWAVDVGRGIEAVPTFTLRHGGIIAAGVLFMVLLRHTLAEIRELEEQQLLAAQRRAETEAVRDARLTLLRRLRELGGTSLDHLASDRPITAADRERFLRDEASIRDFLRGGTLATDEVLAAADRARQRGVEVSVLDDGGDAPLDERDREHIVETVLTMLDRTHGGSVTIRRLPPGRAHLATLRSAQGEQVDRIDVPAQRSTRT